MDNGRVTAPFLINAFSYFSRDLGCFFNRCAGSDGDVHLEMYHFRADVLSPTARARLVFPAPIRRPALRASKKQHGGTAPTEKTRSRPRGSRNCK
ncbi:MAG TPA: hypothetical protein VEG44_02550 [Candidatus Acidoferrales bacterium]|nr:hypothetical protein [Candidatus Acidoferrales bacterium]